VAQVAYSPLIPPSLAGIGKVEIEELGWRRNAGKLS